MGISFINHNSIEYGKIPLPWATARLFHNQWYSDYKKI